MTPQQIDALERLAKLKEQGILTEEELQEQKAGILSGAQPEQKPQVSPPPSPIAPATQTKVPQPVDKGARDDEATSRLVLAGAVIAIAIVAIVLIGKALSGGNEKTSYPTPTVKSNKPPSTTEDAKLGSSAVETKPASPPDDWTYDESADAMGAVTRTATVTANSKLYFDFPYNGGADASFTIRKKRGSTDIYLFVEKGQFNKTYEGGRLRIRLDDKPAFVNGFVGASDGSSNIVFPTGEKRLIAKLKQAKKMVIEAEFYSNGLHQMVFDIRGLKWK